MFSKFIYFFFLLQTCIPIVLKHSAFCIHCALCMYICKHVITVGIFIWFRSQRPKEMLCICISRDIYYCSRISANDSINTSGIFFSFPFIYYYYSKQTTIAATSFFNTFLLSFYPPKKKKKNYHTLRGPLCQQIASFFTLILQMLVIALLFFSCKGRN